MSGREGRSDVGVMSWSGEVIERGLGRCMGEVMEKASAVGVMSWTEVWSDVGVTSRREGWSDVGGRHGERAGMM